MTDRDWIERTLAHRQTTAVPFNVMLSPPAQRRAEDAYGVNWEDAVGLPMRMTGPVSIKPLYADPGTFGGSVRDEFGVVWSTSAIDRGLPLFPCLPSPDLSRYAFPDPAARYRFEHLPGWCGQHAGRYRVVWVGDLWERASFMRGLAPLLEDTVLNPLFVHALLERLTEFILSTMRVLFERFDFEGIAVSDDYGTQRSLVMSPASWRRFVRPCLGRIYSMAHENGRSVFHHSCGDVHEIVGDMIDVGLDILHPIQPEAMDIRTLKREFGEHLTLCGGVPTQDLLVRGTPETVRQEVRRLKRDMGRGGGYILEPGITVQDDVPKANLVALIDEARRIE